MADPFSISVLTPEGSVYQGEGDALVAAGSEGSFGVLPGHAPMLAGLRPGLLKIQAPGADRPLYYACGGGVAEVTREGVGILVDWAKEAHSAEEVKDLLLRETAATPPSETSPPA